MVVEGASRAEAQTAPGQPTRDTLATTVLFDTVKVTGRIDDLIGIAGTASEGFVGAVDLRSRPISREGELLESVPGVIVTQHSGDGKANQYFVRGFNLDHGTDFQSRVEGMPVNMPTHGHGQGWTDLNFLIPELVDFVQYRKGPYYAEEGDFAAVGSARIRTIRKLERPIGLIEAGRHGYRRALAAGSVEAGGGDLLLAAERSRD
ncbi:MAG: TonB-dependent receptor plug domain-containing protein, partial [Gemmatimonadetes bacterium]|nr:TonB-dependent receptor plug domain-containing protein [Gemmatimonadota bacterium]